MHDPNNKSIKLDISKYIKKYKVPEPKMATVPEDVLRAQRVFYRQSFIELLETCSESMIQNEGEKFRAMWTPDGEPLKTMESIMDYIFTRFNANMSQV